MSFEKNTSNTDSKTENNEKESKHPQKALETDGVFSICHGNTAAVHPQGSVRHQPARAE